MKPSLLAIVIVVAVGVASCAKRAPVAAAIPEPAPVAPAAPPAPPPPPPAPAPVERQPTEDEIFARKSLAELNAERPLATIHFELDSAEVGVEGARLLQANAQWLTRWPTTRVAIEGHCDERGTAEYNLALGERRANAISRYLMDLGVAADRLTTLSKGKEQPVCADSGEACWSRNRRGQFAVVAK